MPAIDLIESAYDTLRTAKRDKWLEANARIDREMLSLKDEFDALLYRAADEGANPTQIARKMGASRNTVYDIIKRRPEKAASIILDPLAERYQLDGDTLTVTLDGEDWAKACWEMEWDERQALGLGLNVATFEVGKAWNGAPSLKPISPDFLPEHGNRHPVVAWMQRDHSQAVAWVDGQWTA